MLWRLSISLAVLLVAGSMATAKSDLPPGNYIFVTASNASFEQGLFLIKVEQKDGKDVAAVLEPKGAEIEKFTVEDRKVLLVFKAFGRTLSFDGTIAEKDDKKIVGSFGDDNSISRGRLEPTEKEKLGQADRFRLLTQPEPMQKIQQLNGKVQQLRIKMRSAKAGDTELKEQLEEAQKAADEQIPALYKEVVDKHGDSPAVVDAVLGLLAKAEKNAKPEEAAKWVKQADAFASNFGLRYRLDLDSRCVAALSSKKGFENVALESAENAAKLLTAATPAGLHAKVLKTLKLCQERAGKAELAKQTDALIIKIELESAENGAKSITATTPTDVQAKLLKALTSAQERAGKTDIAKQTGALLVKLEEKLDEEYHAKVPPFKPTKFEGRKEKSERVAVMELFTGAQCPPCVAADVAFDGLLESYEPRDLIMIQNHMHIPGPDPLANSITKDRWEYYEKLFPEKIGGVPCSVFNGKPEAGGGGPMANGEAKFKEYRKIIDKQLEEPTTIKLSGKVEANGERLSIKAAVDGISLPSDKIKLRLLLVEEAIRYTGSNGIRFHHHVLRDMPGGAGGVALKESKGSTTAEVDLVELRTKLSKYLAEWETENSPFPNPDRPLAWKDLRVSAIVQNDENGEILQALQLGVPETK
jgi:hypothetical protein